MTVPVSRNPHGLRHVPIEELAAARGIKPIESIEEHVDSNTFESDEEVEAFLADLYASRRANVG